MFSASATTFHFYCATKMRGYVFLNWFVDFNRAMSNAFSSPSSFVDFHTFGCSRQREVRKSLHIHGLQQRTLVTVQVGHCRQSVLVSDGAVKGDPEGEGGSSIGSTRRRVVRGAPSRKGRHHFTNIGPHFFLVQLSCSAQVLLLQLRSHIVTSLIL